MIVPAGVDKYLPKSGVWTTRGDAHNVVNMRYSMSQECDLKLQRSQRLR